MKALNTEALMALYSSIILSVAEHKNEQNGIIERFHAEFFFVQGLRLIARDYRFDDGSRKYSFHLQDDAHNLVFRYDNEAHWHDIPTFPHHKHLPDDMVAPSDEPSLEQILIEIELFVTNNEKKQ